MNIFELHFNPPAKESVDLSLDTFCFEPKNVHEKRFGSLYMAGTIRNPLPQNSKLLSNIAKIIKDKFYATSIHAPDKAIEDSLKTTNDFLAQELSKDNISWLGNLSFAAIYLRPAESKKPLPKNSFNLHYTKVGKMKIILLRNGEIMDVGKSLDIDEIEPYPLKVFTNTVSAQLLSGDKLLIFTQEIFDLFNKEGLLKRLAHTRALEENKIKEILKPQEKVLTETPGLLLLIDTEKEIAEKPSIMTFGKELEQFSLQDVFVPIIKSAELLFKRIGKKKPKPKKTKSTEKHKPKNIKRITAKFNLTSALKNNLTWMLIFFVLLIIGFFVFQQEAQKQIQIREGVLSEIKSKIMEAEALILARNEKDANQILETALEQISKLTNGSKTQHEVLTLKDQIENDLKNINKLENLSDPSSILDIDQAEFIPQKLAFFQGKIFLFSPLSDKVYEFNPQDLSKNSYTIPNGKPSLSAVTNNSILLFIKPSQIISFNNGSFEEYQNISTKLSDSDPTAFSFYQGNVYLLDKTTGEIIKYQRSTNKESLWLSTNTKKAIDGRSMTIDGSVWILRENNTLSRYYNGQYQGDIMIDIFPKPKSLSKIITNADIPYLYILEPSQNRIIILDKTGRIIKQFQSDKFNNLKDMVITGDGKTLYILNGQSIHKIEIAELF